MAAVFIETKQQQPKKTAAETRKILFGHWLPRNTALQMELTAFLRSKSKAKAGCRMQLSFKSMICCHCKETWHCTDSPNHLGPLLLLQFLTKPTRSSNMNWPPSARKNKYSVSVSFLAAIAHWQASGFPAMSFFSFLCAQRSPLHCLSKRSSSTNLIFFKGGRGYLFLYA